MRLHDFIEYYARENPDRGCVECDELTWNYAEANARANRYARVLRAGGLEKGDRFGYLAKNSADYCIIYFAAAKCGAVPVPLNYRLVPAEWQFILNDAQAKAVFAAAEFVPGIDSICGNLDNIGHYLTDAGDAGGSWNNIETSLAEQPGENLNEAISEDDTVFQMYTSGTTGKPKGVMVTHSAVTNNVAMLARLFGSRECAERLLTVMPLYHVGAAVCIAMTGISQGNTLVVHDDFVPHRVVDTLEKSGITIAGMVPAMIQACLVAVDDVAERNYESLNTIGYGAAPIAEETLRGALAAFKCGFAQIFGMTETAGLSSGLTPADHRIALASRPELLRTAGRAGLGTEIRIVDKGEEVPRGELGEIAVFGPQVMSGYWGLPEATASTLVEGWVMTGDAAYMDEDGYVFIQDRIKDMIVSGAENVYPAEVENALFEHPAVGDAAVIGIPSERWGETVLAFVVTRDGQGVEAEDLNQFCRQRLAAYKVPTQYEFIAELPRNASGKVLKTKLREPFWADSDRGVG